MSTRSYSALVLCVALALATASTSARAQSAPATPAPPAAAVVQEREGEEQALLPRGAPEQGIAVLTLVLAPDSAEVLVDGKPDAARGAERNLSLDPGDHSVEVRAPSYTTQTLDVRLERAARLRKEIQLQQIPPLVAHVQLPETSAPAALPAAARRNDRKVDSEGRLLSRPLFWVAAVALVAGGVITALLLSRSDSSTPANATGGTTGIELTVPGGK